jgi:hypothetical protein
MTKQTETSLTVFTELPVNIARITETQKENILRLSGKYSYLGHRESKIERELLSLKAQLERTELHKKIKQKRRDLRDIRLARRDAGYKINGALEVLEVDIPDEALPEKFDNPKKGR